MHLGVVKRGVAGAAGGGEMVVRGSRGCTEAPFVSDGMVFTTMSG